MRSFVPLCSLLGFLFCLAAAANPLVLEGEVPAEGRFFDVPFEVPAGTVELEVRHDPYRPTRRSSRATK